MNKNHFVILLLLFAYASCNPKIEGKDISSSKAINASNTGSIATNEVDTFIINSITLRQIKDGNGWTSLSKLSGDTILSGDYFFKIDFPDINQDGYKDIRAFVFSTTPNQCENYLFDKTQDQFVKIEKCDLDITLIEGTELFYSYNSTGCGDLDWESRLKKIESWTAEDIGAIEASGCQSEDNEIYIYKIDKSRRKIISKPPMPVFDNNGTNNKWDYVKDYWSKNYKIFLE